MTSAAATASKPQPRRINLDGEGRSLLKRFLDEWVWPRWRGLAVCLALSGILAAATGCYPLIIKNSVDTLMGGKTDALPYILGGILLVTWVRSYFLYSQTVASNQFVLRITNDMQKKAFAHLMEADLARLTRETPGRLVSRLTNDIGFVQNAIQSALAVLIRDTLSIFFILGSMIYLDWVMSLIVLCIYPIAAIPVAVISQRLRRNAKRTQFGLGDMTSLLTEQLSGARLLKSFRLEEYAAARQNRSFEAIFELRTKAIRNRARLDPMLEVLGGLAVAGVIALASWRISTGISSFGDFMGFITALLMAAQPIRAMGNLTSKVQEGLAAVESYYSLIDEKPKIIDKPGAATLAVSNGAINFSNVSFSYDTERSEQAVVDFSLDIPGGQTIALVGRSGAGKTTIINLVPRLFEVTAGAIQIDGQDVRDVTLASLRDNVSIVAQEVTLFDDTIAANIGLGRLTADRSEIAEAAKAAAAHDFIMSQPKGYDTVIGDRGSRLSGGQRQRLALARAILKDAPILLLDEATSALDTESEHLVQQALASFTRDRTTIVIAHRLSTVEKADLICVMADGRIVERGRHADLLAAGGAYSRLANTDFKTSA